MRSLTKLIAIAGFSTLACIGASTSSGEKSGAGKEWVHVTKTEHVDFAPAGMIHIQGSSGELNIEGWDRPEVEVTLVKSTKDIYSPADVEAAKKRLDLVTMTVSKKTDGELTISTAYPPRTFKRLCRGKCDLVLEYQIHVPRNSHLAIHHGTGAVLVSDVTGDIEASTKVGDIVVMVPTTEGYSINATAKVGNVQSDFGGAAVRRDVVGRTLAFAPDSPAHHLTLHVGVGDVNILQMPAPWKPQAAAANQ